MEFPLLRAECRSRQSQALVQEIDFSTLTFHRFQGIEIEEEISVFLQLPISATREERLRDNLQHSSIHTTIPSAAMEK